MPQIIVTQPVAGDIFKLENTYEIKWELIGAMDDHVKISLRESSGGTEVLEVESSFENIGSYFWKVPKNLDIDTDYYIRVETTDPVVGNGTDFEIEAKFTIAEYADLEHWDKVVIVEMEARKLIDTIFIGNRFLLQENADFILQEDGDKIILEQSLE